jgi:hypothetical protein
LLPSDRYETAIKADQFVLMIHGTSDDGARARSLLDEVTV